MTTVPQKLKPETPFVCRNGHKHTESLGGVGLLVGRKRKLADNPDDNMEILVRKKFDLSIPEPPSWYAMPSSHRECGESPEDTVSRAVLVEMGLPRDSFHFSDEDTHTTLDFGSKATIVLATPAKKMGPDVGHHFGHHYTWILVSEIPKLEICPGFGIGNKYLRTLLESLPQRPKKSLLEKLSCSYLDRIRSRVLINTV
ncbi:hypothetical protein F4861DRAFT_69636 [Xylaria intraflava]|nr:hypothetical protein F4861DRAFT_69636 [Xylaria intraflava]